MHKKNKHWRCRIMLPVILINVSLLDDGQTLKNFMIKFDFCDATIV